MHEKTTVASVDFFVSRGFPAVTMHNFTHSRIALRTLIVNYMCQGILGKGMDQGDAQVFEAACLQILKVSAAEIGSGSGDLQNLHRSRKGLVTPTHFFVDWLFRTSAISTGSQTLTRAFMVNT